MNYDLFTIINGMAGESIILDHLMIMLSTVVPYFFMVALAGIYIYGTVNNTKSLRTASFVYGVNIVLTMLIAAGFALVIPESRPFVGHHVHLLLQHIPDNSFPSDHATGTMAIALAIFSMHKKIGTGFIGLSVLVGISRVFVGNHYPLDILGGYGIAFITWLFFNAYVKNFVLKLYSSIDKQLFKKKIAL